MVFGLDDSKEIRKNSRYDNVGGDQKRSFEVVTPAIENEEIDHEGRHEKTDGLEQGEVQRHIAVHAPPKNDDERRDKDSCIK